MALDAPGLARSSLGDGWWELQEVDEARCLLRERRMKFDHQNAKTSSHQIVYTEANPCNQFRAAPALPAVSQPYSAFSPVASSHVGPLGLRYAELQDDTRMG